MTSYNFTGLLVDVKAYNWHMSARPDTTLSANYDTLTTTIPVGGIVVPGTVAGTVDNAGADATNFLGVCNESRSAGDVRPATYTWAGVVRVMTNGNTILVGSRLKCGAEGKVALVAAAGATAADTALQFGRALEASTSDEDVIMAYINMA